MDIQVSTVNIEGLHVEPISRDDVDDHCYDSYYKVYNEFEQEYFADDNPLSTSAPSVSEKLVFSGDLGSKIKIALSADDELDDNGEMSTLSEMFIRAHINIALGAALKLKLMENFKNGVNVDIDALESADASWFSRYVQQQKMAKNQECVRDSDANIRMAAINRRASAFSKRSSCRDSFLTNNSSDSNALIRAELEETKKELAKYQERVAALEAEKSSESPMTDRSLSRLYLPETDSSRDRSSSSGYSTSSEYKEVESNILEAVINGDMEWLLNNLRKKPQSVFTVNAEKRTALHLACMSNSLSIIELLIQHGSAVNAADAAGQTPLHLCSDADVMDLLCKSGGSTGARDNHGYSPLYVHTLHSRDDLVKCLLANNADTAMKDPVGQRTVLHCAAEVRSYSIMLLLLSLSCEDSFLNAQDIKGDTALHIILQDVKEVESLKNIPKKKQGLLIQKCLMLLLNRGAVVNVQNNKGDSPLHYVCANRNLRSTSVTAPLVQILLDMSGDPNAFNSDGCTPLMVAAAHGDWEVCELLVGAGGDLNALCRVTSGYLLSNRQYNDFTKRHCEFGVVESGQDSIAAATCMPSDIIPRDVLPMLYNAISSRQSMVRKRSDNKCGECKETFDLLLPCKSDGSSEYSYVMSLLGMEVDVVSCTESGGSGSLNNCGHCGRYLCQKCLSRSLVRGLMPDYFTQNPSTPPTGVRFSFGSSSSENSDSIPLCPLCFDILLK